MKEIDLHGVRHRDVYKFLEQHYLTGDVPFVVITGKSNTMKKIVIQVAATFGLHAKESISNIGRLIISEGG